MPQRVLIMGLPGARKTYHDISPHFSYTNPKKPGFEITAPFNLVHFG